MKKNGLIILIVGIILVLIPILFPNILKGKNNNSEIKPNNENSKWVILYGSEIKTDKEKYNQTDLKEDYFYSIDEQNSKYIFALPKENRLTKLAYYSNYYSGEVLVEYSDVEITDINTYATKLKDQLNNFDKIYIQKMVINDSETVLNVKANNSEKGFYFEELRLLYKNTDNNYSYVKYQIQNKEFSQEFIDKIINGFKKVNEKAINTNCTKKDTQYIGNMIINDINKRIEFKVDANKYALKDTPGYDNYQENFINNIPESEEVTENIIDKQIYLSFILSDDLTNTLNNNTRLNISNAKEITIDGKKIKKYDLSKDGEYRANYIIDLSSNISMFIDITSTLDNVDSLLKDFIDFKLGDNQY